MTPAIPEGNRTQLDIPTYPKGSSAITDFVVAVSQGEGDTATTGTTHIRGET